MKFTWFVCLVALLKLNDGIYCDEGRGNGRQRRSVSSNNTAVNNDTISALLDKALPVYCSTLENIHGVIPTVQPGLVPGQTPTAQPGLASGKTPTAYPGLATGATPKAYSTMIPRSTFAGGAAVTTPFYNVNPTPSNASQSVGASSVRVVNLNDSQMHDIFQHKGGNYLHDYMATTKEEAEKNFPNLLLMTKPVKVAGTNSSLTAADNMLAQQTIIQDLQKLQVFLSSIVTPSSRATASATTNIATSKSGQSSSSSTKTAPSVTPSASYNGASGHLSSSSYSANKHSTTPSVAVSNQKSTSSMGTGPYYLGSTSTGSAGTSTITSNPSVSSASSVSDQHTSKSFQANLQNVGRSMQTTSGSWVPSIKYPTPTTYPTPPKKHSTFDPVVSKSLSNLDNYLHGLSSDGGFKDLDSLWREANTTIHPESLMELVPVSRRKKRKADGSISMEQYCELKGSKTQDGYLHMCSTCAVITKLPDHYFPRYINEAVCKTGDSNCFVINGISHGECRQRTITLNIMRKKQNKCLLMVHNGENIMIDDWELYPKTVRVSCECLIKKNSFLAPYVKGSLPHG